MASQLSEEQQQEIREYFDIFDEDKSGKLSRVEVSGVVRGLGLNPTKDELEEMFREIDKDGSNEIEYNEFEEYYMKTFGSQNRNEHADLMEAFKTFDKDGNGFIDIEELKDAMLNKGEDHLTDEDFKDMIAAVDIDGDGLVNYEEFVNLMNPQ
ncbi:squidulin-like [Mytilus californianus]|uniref:squidulin-like n=1 Tax=Mytilus californianus TaxID=6549 RepID=UPI002245CB67|nr:squidulin-like [Mytilus californianus]